MKGIKHFYYICIFKVFEKITNCYRYGGKEIDRFSGANMDGRYNGYKIFSNKKAVSLLQKYLRLKEL